MEMIENKSYGPLASLKREFRKQMAVMAVLPILLISTNMRNIDGVLTSVLFWTYVAFCFGMILFSSYNYRLVERMQKMDGLVKTNLEEQVNLLETRIRWKVTGLRIVLLFFVFLLELLPYVQHYKMLNTWHSLSPFIRFGTYAAFFLFQYFVSKRLMQRKFGNHINYLKELVRDMQ